VGEHIQPGSLDYHTGRIRFSQDVRNYFWHSEPDGDGYQQTAQQVATALAQLVATKEPGFWVVPVGSESSPAALTSTPTTTLPRRRNQPHHFNRTRSCFMKQQEIQNSQREA